MRGVPSPNCVLCVSTSESILLSPTDSGVSEVSEPRRKNTSYSPLHLKRESHKNAEALSWCPSNQKSNSQLCKQCGPLLEPIEELARDSESKVSLGDELGVAC